MILTPDPVWPVAVMAVIVLGDGLLTFRPPKVIVDCLNGVGLPRDWWWILAVVKFLAAAGLITGIWIPGVGLAATVGLVAYFLTAAGAHLKAGYIGRDFWLNCLGMLALNVLILVFCFLV
ncbi:DoxX family protein [Brevibacterium sp. ZH18]|uniref:DoxX family protein n=1 Tax=Brevibacterium sp. ZH18 TaxID=2927784 RepID=UPI001F60858A|nr:DoxX family protein [Brevibacterium sp. ZH18]MCI4012184.1 DoxX family protein [Brevibacterium sp. ZH18]